jgi:hypothetical protein
MFSVLKDEYVYAINRLPETIAGKRHGQTAAEALVDHLMTFYSQGTIAIDSEVMTLFFRIGSPTLRGRAIASLGRWLPDKENQEKRPPVSPEILDRLKALWEFRANLASQAASSVPFQGELSEFGWWFASGAFDETWSLAELQRALRLAKTVTPQFKVTRQLADLALRFPLQCIQCTRVIVENDKQGWETLGSKNDFKTIISAALKSENGEARDEADDLVQYLVGRGDFEYRTLLS